ncbi:hypothetical protein JW933_11810, partial [candidate division FCPU426 bacterium]|nr:hypothetical protein [candidate division FCPU426 bacterium]
MKLFAFARSKPENSLKYFASKVYFSSLKVLDKPTFAFLHENDKMGIPQVFRLLRKKAPRYFFVIVNGQQIPTFDSNPERDRLFGRSLTGIHRVLEKGIWRGKCLVHAG